MAVYALASPMSGRRRPSIPEPTRRTVRQRCGFGCILCGLPIYEYDHLVPYSEDPRHEADNLILLCPLHHAEKTKGFLTREALLQASRSPRNRATGESFPFDLRYQGAHCEASIGGNTHVWPDLADGLTTVPLLVDDTPIVAFRADQQRLLLTVQLFNRDNELLVQVLDNELVFSTESWDVAFEGRRLTVRQALRDVFVSVKFDPPGRVVIDRAHIWRNGIEINVREDEVGVANTGSSLSECRAERCQVGVAIGDIPEGLSGAIFMGGGPRPLYSSDLPGEERVARITATAPYHDCDGLLDAFKEFLDEVSADDFAT